MTAPQPTTREVDAMIARARARRVADGIPIPTGRPGSPERREHDRRVAAENTAFVGRVMTQARRSAELRSLTTVVSHAARRATERAVADHLDTEHRRTRVMSTARLVREGWGLRKASEKGTP